MADSQAPQKPDQLAKPDATGAAGRKPINPQNIGAQSADDIMEVGDDRVVTSIATDAPTAIPELAAEAEVVESSGLFGGLGAAVGGSSGLALGGAGALGLAALAGGGGGGGGDGASASGTGTLSAGGGSGTGTLSAGGSGPGNSAGPGSGNAKVPGDGTGNTNNDNNGSGGETPTGAGPFSSGAKTFTGTAPVEKVPTAGPAVEGGMTSGAQQLDGQTGSGGGSGGGGSGGGGGKTAPLESSSGLPEGAPSGPPGEAAMPAEASPPTVFTIASDEGQRLSIDMEAMSMTIAGTDELSVAGRSLDGTYSKPGSGGGGGDDKPEPSPLSALDPVTGSKELASVTNTAETTADTASGKLPTPGGDGSSASPEEKLADFMGQADSGGGILPTPSAPIISNSGDEFMVQVSTSSITSAADANPSPVIDPTARLP